MSFIQTVTHRGAQKKSEQLNNPERDWRITHLAFGDGGGQKPAIHPGMTQLVNEITRLPIGKSFTAKSGQRIIESEIPVGIGGFTVREYGLFDSDGELVQVGQHPEAEKPAPHENTPMSLRISVVFEEFVASEASIIVDKAFASASEAWVQANFSLPAQLPPGTTGQVLTYASNRPGDLEARDLGRINTIVDAVEEVQLLSAGQKILNLEKTTTQGLCVYADGRLLSSAKWSPLSETQIELLSDVPGGTEIILKQNEPKGRIEFIPVGQIVLLALNTTPDKIYGYGQWQRVAVGQSLFGVNPLDADFNTVGRRGGGKTHQHAGNTDNAGSHDHSRYTDPHRLTVSQIPEHRHAVKDRYFAEHATSTTLRASYKEAMPSGFNARLGSGDTDTDNDTFIYINDHTGLYGGGLGHSHKINADGTHQHTFTTESKTHLPPYYTCAIWRRTA